MKKIVPFLFLLLCCPLVACNHYTTTSDITYVMEEDPSVYPNHRYLPLLDIIQQFKDFHEEEIATKENPYISKGGEAAASKRWDEVNTMYNEAMRGVIADLERDVLDLLHATTTINDYLVKLATIQDYLFSANTQTITQYLLDIKTDVGNIILPTSKNYLIF
jgi:hypothetical protein